MKLMSSTLSVKSGLVLAAGLLLGASAFDAGAQDRSYARQNGEARIQGRAVAPAEDTSKRGDSRRGESRRSESRRGDSRDNRYRSYSSNQRSNDRGRGGRESRNHVGQNRYAYDGRPNRSQGRNDHRYRAPAYGARDYRPRDNHYNGYRHNQRNGWRSPNWRNQWRHGWSGNRHRASSRYYYPSGYSSFSWTVGYVLPRAFYRSNYYVNYDAYGLAPPPYGTRWLRVDSDLLLVDIASYEIIEILRGFYYY